MSVVESPGHLGGLDLADRCNTPVLADLLEDRDLLGHGQLLDGTLTERDEDRVRIAKFIAAHPEARRCLTSFHTLSKASHQRRASASTVQTPTTSSLTASWTTS